LNSAAKAALGVTVLGVLLAVAPNVAAAGSSSPLCSTHNPERNAYFGDLHVHTTISADAVAYDVTLRPDDAYRYAFGGVAHLPPLDEKGQGTRAYRNPRPLDFMAVTDHAEMMGETALCQDQSSAGYESSFCQTMRSSAGTHPWELVQMIAWPFPGRSAELCGDDSSACLTARNTVWKETQDAAEAWNKECEHTTFVAYEYSSFRLGPNLHRNVIFRNQTVPHAPLSHVEAPHDYELWKWLASDCLDAGTGCDVLAIPHNMNISNGRMFSLNYPGAWSRAEKAELAELRMRVEPIVEIMQHKGDSECRNGLPGVQGGVDELCDFEKMTDTILRGEDGTIDASECYEGAGADWVPHLGPSCLSRQSYVRTALIEGLRQEEEIGVNPFKFGISASTDTHSAIGGAVDEDNYPGHFGKLDTTSAGRIAGSGRSGGIKTNPGGLIGVWAEENTRDAIFDAMQRKEVFGTSGPRMKVRFYGSWRFDDSLCDAHDRLTQADQSGVAMGQDLPANASSEAPTFLVMGQADPGIADRQGTDLQRLQVIKGWIGEDGDHHQRVFDVAGNSNNNASVDLNTCEPVGTGHRDLCTVWTDPEFDSAKRALYYVRAVENPTCRYSQHDCITLPENERPAGCSDPNYPKTIQERAWSSPIWYTPQS
jgi:hypothetical protein